MLNNLFKNKKKRYISLLLVLMPFVILICVFGFITVKSIGNVVGNVSSAPTFSNSIDTMDYHLRGNATDYQKDLFKELSNFVSEGDDEKIAESVVKNFIADYYTWTNKSGSYDIGGMYYVYSPLKANIIAQSRDEFYKYLTKYIKDYGSNDLLEVTDVSAVGGYFYTTYSIDGEDYKSFVYECEWTYKETEKFDTSDFVTKAIFTVIKNNDGRFEIVECYGEE